MNSKFNVKVNDSYTFSLTEDDVLNLDLSSEEKHLLRECKSFDIKIIGSNKHSKSYTVTVNGNSYNVAIEDELDQLITKMGFSLGSAKKVNSIKAPMPGLILDIIAQIGDQVNEGDNLIILEAMKMENVITSPRDGVIKSISVSKSETVEKNQLLIEFE